MIDSGEYIGVDEGSDGLKFTPAGGFAGTASFQVQGAIDTLGAGLGPAATGIINVTHPSTTTIVSANPDPSDQTQPITVIYNVSSGGPTPTGNVTVTIGGGSETCTGTVAAGQCTLTPIVAGVRDIVATYTGDSVTAGQRQRPALPHGQQLLDQSGRDQHRRRREPRHPARRHRAGLLRQHDYVQHRPARTAHHRGGLTARAAQEHDHRRVVRRGAPQRQ